jgi:hypothetical protein
MTIHSENYFRLLLAQITFVNGKSSVLLNTERIVEVCDATMINSSNEAWPTKRLIAHS